jgi:ArsR family transcriptional regulator, lead/cadmium/zinc/bismuth-responsive transcriptional repressor
VARGSGDTGEMDRQGQAVAEPDVCDVFCIDAEAVARARSTMISDRSAEGLSSTFGVLGDPTRVKLISALMAGELCVCDLATLLGLSQSAVSHQLRVLRNMRLVKYRRDGRIVHYSLDDQHIRDLFLQGLQHIAEG